MSLMNWDAESYAVGVKFADEDHEKLFNLLNQLHSLVLDHANRDLISQHLDLMLEFLYAHFAYEESLMLDKNCAIDLYTAHKLEHAALIESCSNIQIQFNTSQLELSEEMFQMLKKWLERHIIMFDKDYAEFLM